MATFGIDSRETDRVPAGQAVAMDRPAVAVAMLIVAAVLATLAAPRPTDALGDEPRTFLGYACRGDCGPEKDGYAWGEAHGVSDPAVCLSADPSRPQDWIRGCQAYAEENASPEEAGERWATENGIDSVVQCEGAGPGFRAGCMRGLLLDSGGRVCASEVLR
jgi:hypothetical protein